MRQAPRGAEVPPCRSGARVQRPIASGSWTPCPMICPKNGGQCLASNAGGGRANRIQSIATERRETGKDFFWQGTFGAVTSNGERRAGLKLSGKPMVDRKGTAKCFCD